MSKSSTSSSLPTGRILHKVADWLRFGSQPLSDEQVSQAISLSRIALITGLVFLHYLQYPNVDTSPFDGMDAENHQLATFVNSFVLFFSFSAVPLLSMISGWLFVSSLDKEQDNLRLAITRGIAHRFRSLFLPMVAWNALALIALSLLLAVSPGHPLFGDIRIRLEHADAWDYVNAVFGITKRPVAFQFWFVRDLFVTVLLSPLLMLLLRKAPRLTMVALGAVWLTGHNLFIFFRPDVLFFFYLGGLVRTHRMSLSIGLRPALALLGLYLALVALRTSAPLLIEWSGHRPAVLTAATRMMRLVGALACWGAFQHLASTQAGRRIGGLGGLAFFLFAMHFPLIAAVKAALWRWLPAQNDTWMIAHYFASVGLTIALALLAGSALAHVAPRVFAFLNGGRKPGALMAKSSSVPDLAVDSNPTRQASRLDRATSTRSA